MPENSHALSTTGLSAVFLLRRCYRFLDLTIWNLLLLLEEMRRLLKILIDYRSVDLSICRLFI